MGVLMILVLGAGMAPAYAGSYQPNAGATFNIPRSTPDKEFRVERTITSAINHAHKGSLIRISLFSFDRKPVAQALINAHKRGVQVQILLNDHQVTGAQKMLHAALGKDRWRKNFSYECSHGCRSTGENNHIKFFLFSHTGKARNVVMTGSVNFTTNAVKNQYNDVFVKNNAPKLFTAFNTLFDQMRKDKPAHPAWFVRKVDSKFVLEATPYPNFGPKNDPIISILNPVHCRGANDGTGNAYHHTVIRVSMHAWSDRRGTYIAQKLRNLYAAGCDVKVMYGKGGASVRQALGVRTKRGYVPAHTNGYDTNDDGEVDLYTHQKELIISGNYGKDRSTSLVVTGSSNYQDAGLRGDDEIFQIRSFGVLGQYMRNWKFIWDNRSRPIRTVNGRPVAPSFSYRGPAWESD